MDYFWEEGFFLDFEGFEYKFVTSTATCCCKNKLQYEPEADVWSTDQNSDWLIDISSGSEHAERKLIDENTLLLPRAVPQ